MLAYPKTDSRFWRPRLFRWAGSPNYSMRVQFRGRELSFSLRTGNKDLAAKRAATIFGDLVHLGTDATIAKHRAPVDKAPGRGATIGDWVSAASKVFDGKPATLGGYARALRFIVSEILAVAKNKKRYGRRNAMSYRQEIDDAPLKILTPEVIQAWRIQYVQKAGNSPARQRSARITCNSNLRQAKALFSRKILKFARRVAFPDPLPFAGVEFYPRESMRYHSKLDPALLLQAASGELSEADPEAFKALLLALGAGLRRGEIDRLLWRQIDFNTGVIHIETTEAGGLKSSDSAGDVPIDERLSLIMQGFRARALGQYVLEEGTGVTASKPWGQRYRCSDVFERLTRWLRRQGVEGAKPLHTLRKEAGSIIATKAGIHAASQFLRHADIQVTAIHYVDHKERVVVDIGTLLDPESVTTISHATPDYPTPTHAESKTYSAA
jgi:integrase